MARFISDTISVGISKILMVAFGLTTSIVIARWIGPEGNGLIAGLLVYPSLFMTIGSLGIRQAVTYYVGSNTHDLERVKTAVVQIWFFSTTICLLASFLLVRFLSSGGDDIWLVLLAIAPIPFSLFNTYNTGVFLGQNKIKAFNRINWLPSLFVLVAAIAFVILIPLNVYGAMLASIFGPTLMFGILLFKNRFIDSFSFQIDWQLIGSMLRLGSIYAIALLIVNLNYKLNVILLDHLSTPQELGIYSKGAHLIEHMWQIPMLLSTIVFARSAAAKDKDQFSKKVLQLVQISLVVVGFACILLGLLAYPIIVGLFGPEFSESVHVLRILLPGVVLLTFYKVANMDMAGRGKPWLSMAAMVPALGVNIALNMLFIPKYGANGAASASTISYSLAGVLFLVIYCRATNQSIRAFVTPNTIELWSSTINSIGRNSIKNRETTSGGNKT